MSTGHSKAAKEFLKNQTYAKWHDATFWAVRTKRDNMAYGLEEWEQLREKASQIKRHTITHLDEYLEQFATKAEENGCIVHWAKYMLIFGKNLHCPIISIVDNDTNLIIDHGSSFI